MKTKDAIGGLPPTSEKSSFSWPTCETHLLSLAHAHWRLIMEIIQQIWGQRSFSMNPLLALEQHKAHTLATVGLPHGQDTMRFVSCHGWQWDSRIGSWVWILSPSLMSCATMSKLLNLFSSPPAWQGSWIILHASQCCGADEGKPCERLCHV